MVFKMVSGSASGTVSTSASIKGNFVSVQVAVSGVGIPIEELDLIWEKFYKIDKSRARTNVNTLSR